MKKMVNGILVDLTPQEIAAREAESLSFVQQRVRDALSSYTFEKINGGITVDGLFIATGEADRGLINGAVTRAILDDNNTLSYAYYPTGGEKTTLTNAQFKTIGMAISRHVQKCLDAADVVEGAIASYQTIQQVKAAFDAAYTA